jgi:hypothetical protein
MNGRAFENFRNAALAIVSSSLALSPHASKRSTMLEQGVPNPLAHQYDINEAVIRREYYLPSSLSRQERAYKVRSISEQPLSEEVYA